MNAETTEGDALAGAAGDTAGAAWTLADFWRFFRSQFWVIAITLAVGVAGGVVGALVRARDYKTEFVLTVGIVGDTWLHNPMLVEERCRSGLFLERLSESIGRRYSAADLKPMIETTLIVTPTKGLSRDVRITVRAHNPDDCYAIARNLGKLLEEVDAGMYAETRGIYLAYLADLEGVMKQLQTQPLPADAENDVANLEPNLLKYPPDDDTGYAGSAQVFQLFERTTDYRSNPFLISGIALLEQVYVDTYLKTHSSLFSQPTMVTVPAYRPARPEKGSFAATVIACVFAALVLGFALASVNYRLNHGKAKR
jgi:hypothetical protein